MVKAGIDGVLKAVKKVRGGVKVDHHKNTAEMEVVRIPTPSKVVIPMQQHIGAPCEPVVKVGDEVAVGKMGGDRIQHGKHPHQRGEQEIGAERFSMLLLRQLHQFFIRDGLCANIHSSPFLSYRCVYFTPLRGMRQGLFLIHFR